MFNDAKILCFGIGCICTVTGRVGSVITSAVKSLDASANTLDASAKYVGLVGGVLVASMAQDWSPRRHKIGRLGKGIVEQINVIVLAESFKW